MVHEVGAVVNDRYQVEAPIGQGGMGAVYRCKDLTSGQVVAVKQLRTDAGAGFDTGEMLQRFEGEWQLLRTLNHPRIPRMLDSFRTEQSGYFVMEFIDGKSLDQVLRDFKSQGKRFPEELLIQYSLQILDVLNYLHGLARPLLHRDVKPQNIIVRNDDHELFLVDFGLAREGGSATTKTLVGTLGYAPLEQVKGHPEPRSDLYALGATMWHMLVGEQPSPFDIPPLATVRNDVHPALAEVVDRACQDNVNRRYANSRRMEQATRQAWQAITGKTDDQRYDELYLEETPEIVAMPPRSVDAREFLLRAALASASLLLLMVLLYRVKNLRGAQHTASPTPLASATAGEDPGRGSDPHLPPVPPPPRLDALSNSVQIRFGPVPDSEVSTFMIPSPWQMTNSVGSLAPGLLRSTGGQACGFVLSRPTPGGLSQARLTIGRSGPANFQYGFFSGRDLVVGVMSQLDQGYYVTTLLNSKNNVSEPLRRPWNQALGQTLVLERTPQGWSLRDVQEDRTVAMSGLDAEVDHLQIMVPPAQQEQEVQLTEIQIADR